MQATWWNNIMSSKTEVSLMRQQQLDPINRILFYQSLHIALSLQELCQRLVRGDIMTVDCTRCIRFKRSRETNVESSEGNPAEIADLPPPVVAILKRWWTLDVVNVLKQSGCCLDVVNTCKALASGWLPPTNIAFNTFTASDEITRHLNPATIAMASLLVITETMCIEKSVRWRWSNRYNLGCF